MLVQLRRVVYLLVLLQCCACVANATSGSNTKATPQGIVTGKDVDNLISEVVKMVEDAEQDLNKLKEAEVECFRAAEVLNGAVYVYSQVAINVEDFLKTEDAADKAVQRIRWFKSSINGANFLVAKAKEKTANVRKVIDNTTAAAKALDEKTKELDGLLNEYPQLALANPKENGGANTIVERLGKGYDKVARSRNVQEELKKALESPTQKVIKVEEALEAATAAAAKAAEKMEKLQPIEPAETVKKEDEKSTESTPKENQETEPLMENEAQKESSTDSTNHNTRNESLQTDVHKQEAGKQQSTDKEIVKTEQQNETEGSGKVHELLNTSSAVNIGESRNISSGSTSSVSVNPTVSSLSDSSSSPALVHSPLLLLVLLCLLGCTGVF